MARNSKNKIIIFIISLFFLTLISKSVGFNGLETAIQQDDENYLTFNYVWSNQAEEVERPKPPNVWNVLNNVTHFSEPNHTVHLGDDEIPKPLMEGLNWTYMQVNLTALYVWDDHNALGPGDIYVRWVPNYWIGPPEYDLNNNWQNYQYIDDLTIDHDLYNETEHYSIESNDNMWYNFTKPITLYEGWTVLNNMLIEVFEYDLVSADDSLGGVYWTFSDPNSLEGYWEISATDVDIALKISLFSTNDIFTAKNLTELYQPFIMDNDDTDHTADPDGLFARVIHGYDSAIGRNAFCIQYLYYWQEVWLDGFWSDQLIHYDDYELIQIYLNFSYTNGPYAYRFVFDNHDTYTNSTTEWRDSMEYAIYEWDTVESGIQIKIVNNSQQLQPLLGRQYETHFEYKNLSAYTEHFCGCYGGVPSLILTIETYNHQFAVGKTGGAILGQYYIKPYNDTVIYSCYALLNQSFTQGVHDVEGFTVPNYAPFAYDILQVFKIPYIHSNYDLLMQKAASFQGSIEADGGFIQVDRNVELTFEIPLLTSIDIPDRLFPSESLENVLETILDATGAILTIDYYFNISADYEIFFTELNFENIFENSISINFSDPIIQLLANEVKFRGSTLLALDLQGGMLSIDTALTPQLLGEIVNCNITLHLDEILKWAFPGHSWLIELFFDDFYFKVNPILSGYMSGDIRLGNSVEILLWDSTIKDFAFSLDIPPLSYGDTLSLEIIDVIYGLSLDVGWMMGYETGWGISWLFGDGKEYSLATWPNLDFDVSRSEGSILLNTWQAGEGVWISEGTDYPPSIPGYQLSVILFMSLVFLVYIQRRLRIK
jgi:hypothetical protein